ncbi:MAG: polymer-forming cytoskeletal protein [Kiloniellales bacterium]
MFSKDTKRSSTSASANGGTGGEAVTGATGSNGGSAKASGVPSIISADLTIVGDLKSDGDLQIEGTIEGDINSRQITVGEQAKVEGCIVADTVRVSGTVKGQIKAQTVHLDRNAKVTGDVIHATLTMEAGALLEGQVRRLEASSGASGSKVAPLRPAASGNGAESGTAGVESAAAPSPAP